MGKYPCLDCKKDVKNTDKKGSIQCSQCKRWAHADCTGLKAEVLEYFWQSLDADGHHWWACSGCSKAYSTLTARMTQYERELAEIKLDVKKNTDIADKASTKADKVEQELNKLVKDRKKDSELTIKEAGKAFSRELRERESKKMNVVVHNLSEPPASVRSGLARKKEDLAEVGQLLEEIGVITKEDSIKFSFRVGSDKDDYEQRNLVDYPRPLCIGFRTEDLKEKTLDQARHLGNSSTYSHVSIVPDLTVQQREEDKDLMAEMDKRNQDMAEDERGNYEWRCIGRKGQRTLAKIRTQPGGGENRGGRGRGRWQTRGRGRGRGWRRPLSANHVPLGPRQSSTTSMLLEEADMDQSICQGWPTQEKQGKRRGPPSTEEEDEGSSPRLSQDKKKTRARTPSPLNQ